MGNQSADRRRGVALLVVLMLIAGLLVLGQAAMLFLDQVTLRGGVFRRQEQGLYCAEEGLNLGRSWLLANMQGGSQLSPKVVNALLSDPSDPTSLTSAVKDLCQLGGGAGTVTVAGQLLTTLANLCPADTTSPTGFKYQINLVDDIDEDPAAPAPKNTIDPYTDRNSVFILRSSCLSNTDGVLLPALGNGAVNQSVAMVEVNQSGGSGCYGGASAAAGNAAGCGGGYNN